MAAPFAVCSRRSSALALTRAARSSEQSAGMDRHNDKALVAQALSCPTKPCQRVQNLECSFTACSILTTTELASFLSIITINAAFSSLHGRCPKNWSIDVAKALEPFHHLHSRVSACEASRRIQTRCLARCYRPRSPAECDMAAFQARSVEHRPTATLERMFAPLSRSGKSRQARLVRQRGGGLRHQDFSASFLAEMSSVMS